MISKCTPFGCFVDIPELAVSGLVHVSALSRRFVKFCEYDSSLSAPGEGSWHAGDAIRVRLARVDFESRKIDFEPVAASDRGGKRGKGKERRRR